MRVLFGGFMRKPTVKNKYNLTISKAKKLHIKDRSKIKSPMFWRNDVISAWCILKRDRDNEFWLGIYDEDAKVYKGKIKFDFTSYDGMCGYNFKKFYHPEEIENEQDLRIQELALETFNQLIDEGILGL